MEEDEEEEEEEEEEEGYNLHCITARKKTLPRTPATLRVAP